MARIRISEPAQLDIDSIWDYVSSKNTSAAVRFVHRLAKLFERLAKMPRLGERFVHALPRVRLFTASAYVIAYQELDDGILVLRVIHSARDWQAMLDAMDISE
ncbi:MAG: type II toxin-antitoxin system RelE/ParE family toxin [Pirellulales bacterium]